MKPQDVHLWEEFINQHAAFFDFCEYDVLVGNGVVAGDTENDPYAKSFQMLTQKKIDVVGYKSDQVFIVEIKPLAGASAMGQVLGYRNLWLKDNPDRDPDNVHMAIITNMPQSDFAKLYEDHKIALFEVGMCEKCSGVLQA